MTSRYDLNFKPDTVLIIMKNIVYSKISPVTNNPIESSPQKASDDQFTLPNKRTQTQPDVPTSGFENAEQYCQNLYNKLQRDSRANDKVLRLSSMGSTKARENSWAKRSEAAHVYRIVVKNCEREDRDRAKQTAQLREVLQDRGSSATRATRKDLSKLLIEKHNQYYLQKAAPARKQTSAYQQAQLVEQIRPRTNSCKTAKYAAKASERVLDQKAAELMSKVCKAAADGLKKLRLKNSMLQGSRNLHGKAVHTTRDDSYDNSRLLEAFNAMFAKS